MPSVPCIHVAPYIRVAGINVEEEGRNLHNVEFLKMEQEQFTKMAKKPELYDEIGQSIAPAVTKEKVTTARGLPLSSRPWSSTLVFVSSRRLDQSPRRP